MNDIALAIYNRLADDATLTGTNGLLVINKHPLDDTIEQDRKNSIVSFLNAAAMKPVYLTLRLGEMPVRGNFDLTDAFIYIRCYNERDKSFFTINEALSRVRKLLNGSRFPVEGYATVETVFETVRQESVDEGLQQLYREAQFRITII